MGMSCCWHSDQGTQPHCQEMRGQLAWQSAMGARNRERNRDSETPPNHGMQATASSVRCAAAARRA
jgi:hypothetical protein